MSRCPSEVSLSELTRSDLEEFVELAEVSLGFHQGWIVAPRNEDAFRAFLLRFKDGPDSCFVLRETTGHSMVGFVSLNQVMAEPYRCVKIGYGVFVGHARHGHMKSGLRQAIDHIFDVLELHRIEADIRPTNVPSRNLMKALGFECEGVSRGYIRIDGEWADHERWALTAELWRTAQSQREQLEPIVSRQLPSDA